MSKTQRQILVAVYSQPQDKSVSTIVAYDYGNPGAREISDLPTHIRLSEDYDNYTRGGRILDADQLTAYIANLETILAELTGRLNAPRDITEPKGVEGKKGTLS